MCVRAYICDAGYAYILYIRSMQCRMIEYIIKSVFIIFVVYKSISMLIVEVWGNAEKDKIEIQNHSLSYHRYP